MTIQITTDFTNIVVAFATLATSILTGLYIYYTRKTFVEIKKQTDYQIRAYLFASINATQDKCDSDEICSIREHYDESISKLLPDQTKSETNLFIELKNRGKTDICWWKISISICINVGEYLKKGHLSDSGDVVCIESSKANQIIQPENSIKVPIGPMGYIPKAILIWSIEYKDLHGNMYKEFSGDKHYTYINPLLFEYRASGD